MGDKTCPFCGTACKPEDGFCTACGSGLGAHASVRGRHRPVGQKPGVILAVLSWILALLPGLARRKVVVTAGLALASAVGLLILVYHWYGWVGWLFIPFLLPALAAVYYAVLAWLLDGSLCNPLDAIAELDRRQWPLFIVMAALPPALFAFLLFG